MITERFKLAIKKLGLKKEYIAEKLEMTKFDVGNITSNKKKITPELSLLIEEKLGINPIWLIFGRGEMIEAKIDLGKNPSFEKDDFNAKEYLEKQNEFLIQMQKQNEELSKKLL